jgi:hypothetical protein
MEKLSPYIDNPNYVFHGSGKRFSIAKPSLTRRSAFDNEIAYEGVSLHATPHLYIALSYTYDRSNRPCYYTGVNLFEDYRSIHVAGQKSLEHTIKMLWPKDYFGYIYVFNAKDFFWKQGLGPLEVISLVDVKPIKIFKIKNIYTLLKKLHIKINYTVSKFC